ncbi:MAG: hypothetical protein U1F10_16110 [Burkholderiales bacterium]
MLYRIVLHSNFPPDTDPATVKREFARVTGLTQGVTEQLFASASTVIKRQVQKTDAERIAATLRAVGVQTTVELEWGGPPDNLPLGDPSVSPALDALTGAPAKPSQAKRFAGRLRRYADVGLMLAALAGLGWALLQLYEYLHPAPDVTKPVPKPVVAATPPAAEAAAPAPEPFKAAHLEGPWRCTNHRTGLVEYWLYRTDGTLVFNGDADFSKGDKPPGGPDVPVGWRLAGKRMLWLYPGKPEDAARGSNVVFLNLTRFDFEDAKGDVTACRRP